MQGGEKTAQPVQPQQTWQPTAPATQPVQQPAAPSNNSNVTWTASEFIAHTKSAGWYGVLAGASIGVAAIVYFLTKDRMTTGMVLITALLFGIMASRKPRELAYQVGLDGVLVGDKQYGYESFKSFSVIQEGGIESIWFMPLQRFSPGLSIYFAPDDGDKIVAMLSNFLPFEPRDPDPLDKLMHRLRF